jgi:hypothetical protein
VVEGADLTQKRPVETPPAALYGPA